MGAQRFVRDPLRPGMFKDTVTGEVFEAVQNMAVELIFTERVPTKEAVEAAARAAVAPFGAEWVVQPGYSLLLRDRRITATVTAQRPDLTA